MSSEQTPLLGEIVAWDLGSMEVPLGHIRSALSSAGLDPDSAAALRPQTAFRRACKDFRENRTIDKVSDDRESGIVSFQFTRKHLEATGVLEFAYETTVHLDTNTGDISCEVPDIESHARDMFDHAMGHRTTSDLTRLIQRLFQGHAELYPISKKGVAYFVPDAHRPFSAAVETFLVSLGGKLNRFPVPKGTPEGNRSVKQAVDSGLQALADELEAAAEEWSEKTRESTCEKAIERWKQIKHKAESYAEYLGDAQDGLLARLDETRRKLQTRIMEITADRDCDGAKAA